jgi:hypothetical protein
MFDDAAIVTRSADVIARNLREQTLLLDMRSEQYLALNGVAARAWSLLDGANTIDDVAAVIAEEYDAPFAIVRADIAALLIDLGDRGLVRHAA